MVPRLYPSPNDSDSLTILSDSLNRHKGWVAVIRVGLTILAFYCRLSHLRREILSRRGFRALACRLLTQWAVTRVPPGCRGDARKSTQWKTPPARLRVRGKGREPRWDFVHPVLFVITHPCPQTDHFSARSGRPGASSLPQQPPDLSGGFTDWLIAPSFLLDVV